MFSLHQIMIGTDGPSKKNNDDIDKKKFTQVDNNIFSSMRETKSAFLK